MNVNASSALGVPTTLQKTQGASTRVRAPDDGGADGVGATSFLSMLHALTAPEPVPVAGIASGLSAKDAAVAGQETAAATDANGVLDDKDTPAVAALVMLHAPATLEPVAVAVAVVVPAPVAGVASGLSAKGAAVVGKGAGAAAAAGKGANAAADASAVLDARDAPAVAALVTASVATDPRRANPPDVRTERPASHAARLPGAASGAGNMAARPDGDEATTRAAVPAPAALADGSTALIAKSAAAAQSVGDTVARQAAASAQADRDADMSKEFATGDATGDADGETPLPRPLMAALTGASAAPVVSMFEAGLASLRGAAGGRMGERQHARHASAVADGGFVPWNDAMPTGTSHGASPVYAPGATTPVPQAALAQKVHYWVSRGVQSAELQLEAFGGGSVEVHIAVKGDEAVVEFRTDQPQARKMLLDAMPQLQALLADEGLNLSGGFVGSSAQQQSGAGERSGQLSGERQSDARVATVNVATPATPARPASGAAVDLFV
jgi:hypothetical protein